MMVTDEDADNRADASLDPEAQVMQQQTVEQVRRALEALPADFREVLVLRELEGLSYKEIAAIVGIPLGTVMSRLARARERLTGVSIHVSPIAAPDGRIYLASAGKSYVVRAGEKFEILATNDLGDDSPASPAVADGRMFLKGRKMLYCVGEK